MFPDLSGADLSGEMLAEEVPIADGIALLKGIDFSGVFLHNTNLSRAQLTHAHLNYANLNNANLEGAILLSANLSHANVSRANFSRAQFDATILGDNDLSTALGLDTVIHTGPSIVGVETLYKSGGKIPRAFLSGCGVPDDFITHIPSLVGAVNPIQFYSCFISYSTKDEGFAKRLYSRMRDEQLRVWFAPEDVRRGEKLREQIDRAIQIHDRLLVVLSENSLQSRWVEAEIRRARKIEVEEKRRKLFPIRLVSYERLRQWECFDSDTGEDLAREVREYYIPDFSNWKDHDSFEPEFAKLLRDLRAAEAAGQTGV